MKIYIFITKLYKQIIKNYLFTKYIMNNKRINLIGFNIWNNNNNISGKSIIDYSLGKMRNTVGSTTRIYKNCAHYSSDPLNCTLGLAINNVIPTLNQISQPTPSLPTPSPPTPSPPTPSLNLDIPSPPTMLNATLGNEETDIAFSAGLNSGPSITDYLYSIDGNTYVSSGSTSSPIRIRGLTNGVTYNITIKAVNSNGRSIQSSSVSVTPSNSGPLPPVLTGITFKTTDTMIITFTQEANGITITNYKYSIDGGNNYTAFSPVDVASPVTISGLSSNTTYNICLKAISAVGESASSNTITETTYANVNYVTFTETGSSTWTVPENVTFVQYLVVGGGGGGGATYSKINVLGDVLVTGTPQAGKYWINNTQPSITGRFYGRMYFGFASGQTSVSFTDPARLTASETILGDPDARYDYNKWYGGIELVYSLNGLVTTTNWVPPYQINSTQGNNISGGSGGGAGGQVKALTGANKYNVTPGTTYTIIVGAGGQGGVGGSNSETNGTPGEDSSFDTIISFGGSGGAVSRNMDQLQDTNKFGKGGNGGQGYGNLVGGSGGGQNSSNNYGRYNSAGAGSLGSPTNFYGTFKYYGAGGNGGVPNTVTTGTTLANVGKGGSGTGATVNSFADGIDGGSGLVVIRYYT